MSVFREFDAGEDVYHISVQDMQPIIEAYKNAKKTKHRLTEKITYGSIPIDKSFDPPIPPGTVVGMMFISKTEKYDDGGGYKLFWLVGGVSEDDFL